MNINIVIVIVVTIAITIAIAVVVVIVIINSVTVVYFQVFPKNYKESANPFCLEHNNRA